MKTPKRFAELAAIIAVTACLPASGAIAADMAERQPVCRNGMLSDSFTGKPLFDRTKKDPTPIPCGVPVTEADPMGGIMLASAVGAGVLGVGICAAAGCFDSHNPPPPVFFPPGQQASR